MAENKPYHMCPYCDCVFVYHTEVRDHILHDHPDHAQMAITADPHELPRSD